MAGASIEATLDLWGSALRDVAKAALRPRGSVWRLRRNWSWTVFFVSERWTSFEPPGPMTLERDDAVAIVRNGPLFRIEREGFIAPLFD